MDNERPYIEQETAEDNLYTQLQKQTLDELQRLSGKVWTDFNVHDPGITLADAANHVLTEIDYKLGFELQDYLTDTEGNINYEKYGLFRPEKVYTTAPVTAEDYRKLFITHFPELEKILVEADIASGNYNVKIVLSPFDKDNKGIEKEIRLFFHSHRNLCENIKDVIIVNPQQLVFESDFEIETGTDATVILAEVYWTIIQYLSGSIQIASLENSFFSGLSPEEWLEGTYDGTRVTIPQQRDTEHELYLQLCKISGINSFKTCYLLKNGKIQTDFKEGFSLFIPCNIHELQVNITVGNSVARIDMERFTEELQALYYTRRAASQKDTPNNNDITHVESAFLPSGTYRDIFTHYPVGMDLPGCYQTRSGIISSSTIPDEKWYVRQLKAYLKLYDLLAERGLKEVKEMKSLLSIEEHTAILSEMEILGSDVFTMKDDKKRYRNVFILKNKYLDLLDRLYGVDSSPSWMEEFTYYGETKDELLIRRIKLLQNATDLRKFRGKARNIKVWRDGNNIPTVKKHLCYLLGMNMNEEISVGNVLPSHNLALLGTKKEGQRYRDRLNAMLISESMLDHANIHRIEQDPTLEINNIPLEEYEKLREELDIFNSNFISGGLFRGGINLNNYKLVEAYEKPDKTMKNEFLLVFWNEEEEKWMNLERSNDKTKLKRQANILRCYLCELNRLCETVYVIEHNLFTPSNPFTLSFVFPKWTARFQSPRFREICCKLVRSLIPPHLKASLYWLDIPEMQYFEKAYRLWRKALANDTLQEDTTHIEENMIELLTDEEDKNKKAENINKEE